MKKFLTIVLAMIMAASLFACGGGETSDGQDAVQDDRNYGPLLEQAKEAELYLGELTTGVEGDTLSNVFFDWTVNSVRTATELEGQTAGEGKKFIVVSISVTNTTDEDYEVGNYDFVGYTVASEDGMLDTEYSFYDEMYPDEATLKAGDTLTGDLVFITDRDADELIVDYIEFMGDESTGNTNWFDLVL